MATGALDTNLLQSAKRPKGDAPKGGSLGPARSASRRKRILKVLAYVIFFFWSMITFTVLKIPDSVVANFLISAINQNTVYQSTADKIAVGFFPTAHLRVEKLSLDPKDPSSGPAILIDSAKLSPNPFAIIPLFGAPAYGGPFRADAYKTSLRGSVYAGSNFSFKLENAEDVDLGKLTPLIQSGFDLKGFLKELHLNLSMPMMPVQRLGMSEGDISIKGKNVVFDPSGLSLPVPLPILNLGDLDIQGTVTRGQLKLERFRVGSPGKDLELQIVNGTVTLSDVVANSRYDLHLLLKLSPGIAKVLSGYTSLLANMATVKPDGSYAMKLSGNFMTGGLPEPWKE